MEDNLASTTSESESNIDGVDEFSRSIGLSGALMKVVFAGQPYYKLGGI